MNKAKVEPKYLQRLLQHTVKPMPPADKLHVDQQGRVRLYCTRNYERGCIVLRVRTQSRPNAQHHIRDSWPAALVVTAIAPAEEYCRWLDALVDMVRLQNPDYTFVVTKKYPGQKAV